MPPQRPSPKPAPIAFATILKNYSNAPPCVRADGQIPAGYENQCAMRVGKALERSGVSFDSFHGGRCPVSPSVGGLAASAEGLAKWLVAKPFPGCDVRKILAAATWDEELKGRTGIVYFKDYWRRKGEQGQGTGDHIDLWNRDTLTPGWTSFLRFRLGINQLGSLFSDDNVYSDLNKSRAVWFFSVV